MRAFFRPVAASLLITASVGCGSATGRCENVTTTASFCVPDGGAAPAGQTLTLQVMERCGGCGTSDFSCSVSVDAGSISLRLGGQACEPPGGAACLAVCRMSTFSCALPALAEGNYVVTAPGEPAQMLRVGDGGTRSCQVLFP